MTTRTIPKEFFWRRLHSLLGLWLVLFLIEHLLTNSQAALFIGDDGIGFIRMVNLIHSLPYLPLIELGLLLVPFLIHGLWGLKYARESKINSYSSDGSKPSIKSGRNRAFTWQRITSWILAFMVIFHVVSMRFLKYPEEGGSGVDRTYSVQVSEDPGLKSLAGRLNVDLLSGNKAGEVIAVAPDFGTATLLVVRDTFKNPLLIILYTLFVLSAAFHAGNGVWTAWITWGFNVSKKAQERFLKATWMLTALLSFCGLAAVWLTYYNLSA
ncbi:MAG: succinate dehydrogenase [Chlamydiia bacterium]|nr:succinate dehydrogenase [Chlamydiia bacterium]